MSSQAACAAPSRRGILGAVAGLAVPGLLGLGFGVASGGGDPIAPALARAQTGPARPAPAPGAVRAPYLCRASAADRAEWALFRSRYLAADGRVIDTGNRNVSHTEGQGWGMLFAVSFDDRDAFDRIWNWTRATLRRDEDSLHSWRYDPACPDPVSDPNNATDGDLYIAWALWRAAFRWQDPSYAQAAARIATDLLDLLVVETAGRCLLLPGIIGFETAEAVNINPSYYCFPALRDLSQAVRSPRWEALRQTGLGLIDAGRFGRFGLPPDWLGVARHGGALAPAAGRPARFSYDAIRIPLYLQWTGQGGVPAQCALRRFWAQTAPASPAWVDLRSGATAPGGLPPGMQAVAKLAMSPRNDAASLNLPSIHSSPDYYSSALILLSRLAVYEMGAPLSI